MIHRVELVQIQQLGQFACIVNDAKYIGMDVHQATISVAVRDSRGNLVMEAILETKADTILEFIHGLRGSLSVTFEEGTWAAWLYDLLQPNVTRVVASDPRKNALLKAGNKSDRIADTLDESELGNSVQSRRSATSKVLGQRSTPSKCLVCLNE